MPERSGPPIEELDEAAILADLRAGSATPGAAARSNAAFEKLVRAYSGRMLAVARRFISEEEDARDALQDAFLSAVRGIQGFEGSSRLSTWLHRIVVNACLMKLRSRSRRRAKERSVEELLPRFHEDGHAARPAAVWKETPEDLALRSETRVLVRSAIDQLPEGYRTVLLLRDIEGFDTDATAEVMEMSAAAVKTRLHRARQALRELLDGDFRPGGESRSTKSEDDQ